MAYDCEQVMNDEVQSTCTLVSAIQDRRSSGISPDDRSLLAFLLRAQQEDPAGIVTDKHIR